VTTPTPELLRWDNWTPPTRTPWGGRAIPDRLKVGLPVADALLDGVVGESWELSVDPTFPSRLARDGRTLAEVIAADPARWLGRHAALGSTPILVKLLDAREDLSVQVHPDDDDPWLAPHESGKPECWVVLDREPGAGLYLGLADGVTRESLHARIAAREDIHDALNFVPVERGDAFVIEAGTVHAVGGGVTLLEPQLVHPGRTGLTYRLWDWGRRYDARGRPDPDGNLRPLHVERSFASTRWDAPRGRRFVDACRATPTLITEHGGVRHEHLVTLRTLEVSRLTGDGPITLPPPETLAALVVTRGHLALGGREARMGQTLVVPAAFASWTLDLAGEAFVIHLSSDS
jgi:mannose-6-phosphate isomerase